jgi:hypothetical protein
MADTANVEKAARNGVKARIPNEGRVLLEDMVCAYRFGEGASWSRFRCISFAMDLRSNSIE